MSDVGYRRCCGMDVHKDTVVVCVLPPDGQTGTVVRKTYGTFRNDLSRMRGWLQAAFRLLLVNPPQVKALQGRKSDGRDARRIAGFLQDGRLDPSFVPPQPMRELRQMLRHRLSLLHQRGEAHNQIRDLFETANIKLSSLLSDLPGVPGRRIIMAMIAGEDSPELLSF